MDPGGGGSSELRLCHCILTWVTEQDNISKNKSILKFIQNQKRAQMAKAILSKKNKARSIILANFILQGYSNQNSMILVQKQTQIPMKQVRELRNKTTLTTI